MSRWATAAVRPDGALHYRERPAPAFLGRAAACTWRSRPGPGGHVQRLLPDGCVEVVVSPGRPALVYGPRSSWFDLHVPAGEHRGVRLLPGVAAGLLRLDVREITDRVVRLEDLLKQAPPDDRPAVSQLAGVLGDLFRRGGASRDPEVARALDLLHRQPGVTAAAVARACGLSERQLRRRFARAVGMPPTTYRRVARVNATLHAAHRVPAPPWARLAADLGYADQAHLVREVRALTGSTPTAVLGRPRTGSSRGGDAAGG